MSSRQLLHLTLTFYPLEVLLSSPIDMTFRSFDPSDLIDLPLSLRASVTEADR